MLGWMAVAAGAADLAGWAPDQPWGSTTHGPKDPAAAADYAVYAVGGGTTALMQQTWIAEGPSMTFMGQPAYGFSEFFYDGQMASYVVTIPGDHTLDVLAALTQALGQPISHPGLRVFQNDQVAVVVESAGPNTSRAEVTDRHRLATCKTAFGGTCQMRDPAALLAQYPTSANPLEQERLDAAMGPDPLLHQSTPPSPAAPPH